MSTYTHSVTIFCGSHHGNQPEYTDAAKELAKGFVQNNIRLVFGGGNVGIMGVISNTILDLNGEVKGIIPRFLQQKEGLHSRITDLVITEDMHARKKLLYSEADAFICMPGGVGTFDETFEILTWKQIGLHQKPIFIIDIENWSAPLQQTLKAIVDQGFADKSLFDLFEVTPDIPTTLARLQEVL